LTAENQYLIDARLFSYWGYKKLAHGLFRHWTNQHRRTARTLIDRVLFLEGTPAMSPNGFEAGNSVETIYSAALAAEMAMRDLYVEAAKSADDQGDWVTEDLLTRVLVKLERRVKTIETQIELISEIGIELYQQEKI
jgi:bacterioferritin